MASSPPIYWYERRLGQPAEGFLTPGFNEHAEPPWPAERWIEKHKVVWLQGHPWSGIDSAVESLVEGAQASGRLVILPPAQGPVPPGALVVDFIRTPDRLPEIFNDGATTVVVSPPTDEMWANKWVILAPAPLRWEDAITIATAEGLEPESFREDIRRLRLEGLASLPGPLRVLCGLLHSGAPSRASAHERISRELGSNDPLFGHLALLSVLTGQERLFLGATSEALDLREAHPGISDDALKERMYHPLFEPAWGEPGWVWSIPSLRDFLAARALLTRTSDREKIGDLLFHPFDGRVPPRLRRVAGWVADLGGGTFREMLAHRDPIAALAGTPDTWSEEERRILVEALLVRATEIALGRSVYPDDLARLAHPGLAEQLRPWLRAETPRSRLLLTMAIASANRVTTLGFDLARLAAGEGDRELRRSAISALWELREPTAMATLRPWLEGGPEGRLDTLWRTALSAMWETGALDADALFTLLQRFPDELRYTFGARELQELVRSLDRGGLLAALRWAARTPEESWAGAVEALADRVASLLLADDAVREVVIDALVRRLGDLEQAFARALGAALGENTDLRRRMLQELMRRPEAANVGFRWSTWQANLVRPEDLSWLLDRMAPESPLAGLAERILDVAEPDAYNLFLTRYRADPERYAALRHFVFWELDSAHARMARQLEERKQEARKQEPYRIGTEELAHKLEELLARAEEEPVKWWWTLLSGLTLKPGDSHYGNPSRTRVEELPGWARLDLRERVIDVARRFLTEAPLEAEGWLGTSLIPGDIVAGICAFELMDPVDLSDETLARWAPAIVARNQDLHGDELRRRLTAALVARAPSAVHQVCVQLLDRANHAEEIDSLLRTIGRTFRTIGVGSELISRFAKGTFASDVESVVFRHLLAWGTEEAWNVGLRQAEENSLSSSLAAEMLKARPQEAWEALWSWLFAEPDHMRALEGLDLEHQLFEALGDEQLAELYLWLDSHVPHVQWPTDHVISVEGDYAMDRVRSRLFNTLAGRSSESAAVALERVLALHPTYDGVRAAISEVRDRARTQSWRPPTSAEIEVLLSKPEARLIRTELQLKNLARIGLSKLGEQLATRLPALFSRGEDGRRVVRSVDLSGPASQELETWLQSVVVGAKIEAERDPRAESAFEVVASVLGGDSLRIGIHLTTERKDTRRTGLVGLLADEQAQLEDSDDVAIIRLRLLESADDLLHAVPWAKSPLQALEDQGFVLKSVYSLANERTWILKVGVPSPMLDRLYPADELLVLLLASTVTFQDIAWTRKELARNGPHVDPELVVLVDSIPELDERLSKLPVERGMWVPWAIDKIASTPLAERIATIMPANDIFNHHTPVLQQGWVFGREEEIAEICDRVLRGESIGVFGLRKIGKTTAVLSAASRLDPAAALGAGVGTERPLQALMVRIDAQTVLRQDIRDSVRQLINEIVARAQRAGLSVARPDETVLGLGSLLEVVLEQSPLPIGIVIDECDLLFVGDSGESPIPGVASLLGMLRGLSQTKGRLSVVLIGRNPSVVQAPILEGFPNPFLAWFSVLWLPPLPREAADRMLARFGERVGLDVAPSTLDLAWHWTGGHAFLHRQFGSALRRAAGDKLLRPIDAAGLVGTGPLEEPALDRFEEGSDVEVVVEDIIRLLERHFPEAYEVLVDFSCEGSIVGGWSAPGALTLRRLGLLTRSDGEMSVPKIVLQRARFAPKLRTGTGG